MMPEWPGNVEVVQANEPSGPGQIAIRVAGDADRAAVARLAVLDGVPTPTGPLLLALVDGEPVAALALADGRAIADPFRPTLELVALLRVRAAQIAGPRRRTVLERAGARLRPRPA